MSTPGGDKAVGGLARDDGGFEAYPPWTEVGLKGTFYLKENVVFSLGPLP